MKRTQVVFSLWRPKFGLCVFHVYEYTKIQQYDWSMEFVKPQTSLFKQDSQKYY